MSRITLGLLAGALLACCAVNAQTLADWNLANPANQPSAASQPAPKPAPKPLIIDVPAPVAPRPGMLTNSEILSMLKNGLPPEVVAAKIKTSPCDFDTSVEALTAMHAQGIPATVLTAMVESPHDDRLPDDGHIRVFITDSQSWEVRGGAFGQGSGSAAWNSSGGSARSSFTSGAFSSGGARPQTMEIVKTFGERCPELIVTNKPENANYVVTLDHEGGKNLLSHHNKIAVFNRQGDAIFSRSTIMLGDSVKDACQAIHSDTSVKQVAAR